MASIRRRRAPLSWRFRRNPPGAAQQSTTPRASELERRGNYEAAAQAYRELLAGKPGDVSALLGLEQVLPPLNKSAESLPQARAGLAAESRERPALRGGAALAAGRPPTSPTACGPSPSLLAARPAPGDEAPYRGWGAAALTGRRRDGRAGARNRLGRGTVGRSDVLAAEMAHSAVVDGDYPSPPAGNGSPPCGGLPGYRITAVATLGTRRHSRAGYGSRRTRFSPRSGWSRSCG